MTSRSPREHTGLCVEAGQASWSSQEAEEPGVEGVGLDGVFQIRHLRII